MKKGLKIGMLAMAFLAAMTAVISTGKVSAETGNNEVTVEISPYNGGVNNCEGSNYVYNFSGSSEVQTGTTGGNITCIFGSHQQGAVTLQIQGDLDDGNNHTISSGNVKVKNGNWTWTPEGLGNTTNATSNSTFEPFTSAVTLFNKNNAKIGDASGTNIEIQVVVPEGQPDGTYQGILVLTF